ncbi:MAG: hypothetical protein K6G36_01820 [Candidatus Saccharibacteria bacterium]|nr:hypothetical protein [Candidatus Saccharibacteria bacterium]
MEKAKEKKSNGGLIAIIAAAAVVVIGVVVALIFILGGNKGKLVGKWKSEYGSWYYNFTSETEGGYGTDAFDIPDQPFTYTDNGDSITIQYEGVTSSMTLNYRLEDDGKKLIVVDSFGSDTVYIRQ